MDDEQLQPEAGDFLFLDGQDLADAMGGIDDELVGTELGLLRLGHSVSSSGRSLTATTAALPKTMPSARWRQCHEISCPRRAALRQAEVSSGYL